VGACPFDALTLKETVVEVDLDKCTSCGICENFCPVEAIVVKKPKK
jgi:NAD-dependent dihydropyrimidine dehydrogenase PreA subunit